jgi:NodT family efflux transporter outer membrane factor (OMF) lipoprotein
MILARTTDRPARDGWPVARGAVLAAGLILGGCAAVGPTFKPPAAPAVAGYAAPGDRSAAIAVLDPRERAAGPWWRALGSEALDTVMARALAGNPTAAAARASLAQARARTDQARGALAPEVTAAAGYQRERIDIAALGFPGFPSPTIGLYSIGPSVSYNLDLAGGGRRRVEATRAHAEAEGFRADAAYLALTGNVALQAVTIAALNAQIAGVGTVVDDDRKALSILNAAEAAGGGARTAALGGRLRLQQDLARLQPLEQSLAEARHALSLLAGEAPGAWSPPDFALDGFRSPATIPVALPSALVRRRPDIRAAEADLHADTAQIGVATAALYPDIRLSAGLAQEALSPGSLFGFGSTAYNFGPSASVPIFDGGALRAGREAARAQAAQSLAVYRQTVTAAFVQVADVLSAIAQDDDRMTVLDRAERDARASLEDARAAYRLGGTALANVLVADRQWREASLARVDAQGRRLADIIALYGATAADWRSIQKPNASQ